MYSKWKQIGYDIGNGVIKQKKMATVCFMLSLICVIWNIWDIKRIWDFYHQTVSVADLLIDLQNPGRFGIMIFPIMLFFILRCKQDSIYMQVVLRYGNRNRMFRNQLMESGIYALGMSTILILLESAVGYLFVGEWINWEDIQSRFYSTTGLQSTAHFGEIVIMVWLLYILKFLLILVLMDMLFWYQKYLFFIWIPVILFFGLETPIVDIPVFHTFYCIQYAYILERTEILLPLLIGVLLLITEYLIGTIFIKKKDIFE